MFPTFIASSPALTVCLEDVLGFVSGNVRVDPALLEEVPQPDLLVSRGNFLVTGLIVRQLLTSLPEYVVDIPPVL